MNINRHNYEEYFLLYADNEMSAAEKDMVEAFLAANPDLREEMQMLQRAILKPEQVLFAYKENLQRPHPLDAGIQHKLLLLLDNELDTSEKLHIQSLTKNDDAVKKEWELLQQTKLAASDSVVFPDKASLYKKEKGRVVGFAWWKMAAAAMLIGFGLWGAVSYFKKVLSVLPPTETAGVNKGLKQVEKTSGIIVPVTNQPEHTVPEKEADAIGQNSTNSTLPEKVLAPAKKIMQDALPKKADNETASQQGNNDQPKRGLENLNNPASNKTDIANVRPEKKDIKNETGVIEPTEDKITLPVAINTAFIDNNDSKKNFAYFDEEEEDKPRKTRIGGFFKKVKRVLERKANIKTGGGDNIKIANMSFAMH